MEQALSVTPDTRHIPSVNMEDNAMGTESIIKQVRIIQDVMKSVMQEDQHYGLIPGCGNKPSLLKPGAEKLTMTFRLAPKFHVTVIDLGKGHKNFDVKTELFSIVTGAFVGEGVGSCSTMESKYRFRKAEQKCPECGKETIIKGKKEYGGGWICFKKKGGCGAKFEDGDPNIENQDMGRVEHDNPADYYNTCLKMAKKRSLVDATLTATAASDIFTQDIEDMDPEIINGDQNKKPSGNAKQKMDNPSQDKPFTDKQLKTIRSKISEKDNLSSTEKENLYRFIKEEKADTIEVNGKKVITKKSASTIIETFDDIYEEFINRNVSQQSEGFGGVQPDDDIHF